MVEALLLQRALIGPLGYKQTTSVRLLFVAASAPHPFQMESVLGWVKAKI
jgi:hypothetical protein